MEKCRCGVELSKENTCECSENKLCRDCCECGYGCEGCNCSEGNNLEEEEEEIE